MGEQGKGGFEGAPDWRDLDAYQHLWDMDRAGWAWEWLRRNADYRADAVAASLDPAAWGCAFAEAADRSAPLAKIVWDASCDDSVLLVDAVPVAASDPDAFVLARFAGMATIVAGRDGRERVVISDGYRRIRIDVVHGSLGAGPVLLRYRLHGFADLEARILTLRRLVALNRHGRFARSLHPREHLARRWIPMLRAHDAICAGATQREIADVLFGTKLARDAWRGPSDFLRLRVQRLIRAARHMVSGGYRTLLR